MSDELPETETKHPWHLMFAGCWCWIQLRNGSAQEGKVESVTETDIWLSECMQVYQEIPGVRPPEALIESQTAAIPVAEVVLIRTADRKRSEKFCAQFTGASLVRGANTLPFTPHRVH